MPNRGLVSGRKNSVPGAVTSTEEIAYEASPSFAYCRDHGPAHLFDIRGRSGHQRASTENCTVRQINMRPIRAETRARLGMAIAKGPPLARCASRRFAMPTPRGRRPSTAQIPMRRASSGKNDLAGAF